MRRAAGLVALALGLAGCGVQVPKQPEARTAHKARTKATATPVALPSDPRARLAAAVRAVPAATDVYRFDGDDKLIEAPFGPVLLRHGHVPDAGHGQNGVVAAYYLRPQGSGFALAKAFPEAVETGSFGDLGEWSVSNAYAAVPTLVVEGGGTWQGCTVSFTDLVALRPGGPVTLASVPTFYDDSGMVETGAQQLEGTITDIVPETSFTVRYKGTGSFAERYVRQGGRFVPEGGESKVPGC